MDELDDDQDLGFAYSTGYTAGREVAEDMGERMGHSARKFPDPKAEAMRRVMRGRAAPLEPHEREAVAEGIDDGLNGRRPRY